MDEFLRQNQSRKKTAPDWEVKVYQFEMGNRTNGRTHEKYSRGLVTQCEKYREKKRTGASLRFD